MSSPALYAQLSAVILSAVGVVTMTFSLFNSVLKDLMPQVEGAVQTVSFVSLGTVVVLLALMLLIRRRLGTSSQYAWAGVGLLLLIAAVFTYFSFGDTIRRYTYFYPPVATPSVPQKPHVYGPLHAAGKERVGNDGIAITVSRLGGPEMVNGHQLLWMSEARSEIVGTMVRYYAAVAFLMTTALLVVAIAVWRAFHGQHSDTRPPRVRG